MAEESGMKRFFKKLKDVGLKDMLHILLFVVAYPISLLYRLRRKDMWLVCEYENEARDNGYWFYKYVCEHTDQDVVYAINPKSPDYEKVAKLGETVSYGTLKHWIYYLAASVNISSQKGGKPNAAVCYLLEVYGVLKNKRVFLQHGITKDFADVFIYKNTKMRLFICGAKPEYDFVRSEFGYPEGFVAYTGFARFDYLLAPYEQKRQLLIAPTWRSWLRTASSDPYKKNSNKHITESEYYNTWRRFIESERLSELCRKYDMTAVFYPHRNVAHCFDDINSPGVTISNWEEYDLQLLMKESAMMLTDYTSAVMDFAYMGKPVIYYQFDYEKYRSEHFTQGYFDYERDGFGEVVSDEEALFEQVEELMKNPTMSDKYKKRLDGFFLFRDQDNCKRIYEQVKAVDKGDKNG